MDIYTYTGSVKSLGTHIFYYKILLKKRKDINLYQMKAKKLLYKAVLINVQNDRALRQYKLVDVCGILDDGR
jgi:hypothetical protein